MSEKLYVKSDLNPAIKKFKDFNKEYFKMKLTKDQMESVVRMIMELPVYKDDSDLELIVLKEIGTMVMNKLKIISAQANFKLLPSQALVLFTWFNGYNFQHPLEESLSREIVDVIYKQVI